MLEASKFNELKISGNLPSPKGTVLKIMELSEHNNVPLPELIAVLNTDPVMIGRLLKLANSASFVRSRPAVALTPDVLMSIGLNAVRQIALTFALVAEHHRGECQQFDYNLHWSRALACGAAMQLLGQQLRIAPPGELFTIGILSSIGQLAMATLHPVEYGALIQAQGNPYARGMTRQEESRFGYHHLDIAGALLRDWGLPAMFCDAVRQHEDLPPVDVAEHSRAGRLALCLHLASRLADVCLLEGQARAHGYEELKKQACRLEVDPTHFPRLCDEVVQEWRDWSAQLSISTPRQESFSLLERRQPAPVEPAGAEEELPPLHILVVEDEASQRMMLQRLLQILGHQVDVAANGQEAFELVQKQPPQLVITDLAMPEMDGMELIRRLRALPDGRQLYIIVLTILDDEDNLAAVFSSGADDFISKPIPPRILQARLKAGQRIILEQQNLRQEQARLRRHLEELSIDNRLAQEAAQTDGLTGLYNRHYAMRYLPQIWEEARLAQQPLSALMLDIDHFKVVNDEHGHDVGDNILQQFAGILRLFCRRTDIICRFGGEEFLIILPDTRLPTAIQVAERIRATLASRNLVTAGLSLSLTVSIGVAENQAQHKSVEALIKSADQALYRAKRTGRNRVEAAP
ncbi:diguanylate cyclase [Aquitalea sp. USM4]|uniref:diguanylate cyclase n=1 Tax=Aquitalea sp. USM4 TaxID=1590041 RepID=UPI0010409D20|nr:diguanylate cyclase [Aquitalea sp. USM4]QBJ78999.1 diguanylate cyclase response regulator [Aquitalea sp. USM4]